MRVIGLDVGAKTIGVAVSDALGWTAQGLETIRRKRVRDDLERIRELVQTYAAELLVLGLPRNMNGSYGPQAAAVQEFGRLLAAELSIAVAYWDERLTTVAAQKTLLAGDISRAKRRQVVDKLAAVLILQNYLDSQTNNAEK
ncbi:MAG: Holliday junction resolvase RuvX [Heliobacteriaceae bacterium]|nr:Holliday junction resolvase RuvX [Heliobacteriaceae bacterium]MDD4587147.1 Holliday junction resolvase RuvX [Heliobacteriaceae bacterium]